MFLQKYINCIYINISLLKTKNINTKMCMSLEQLRMINIQQTSAISMFAVLSKCGFHHHYCQSQPQSFFFYSTCFFGGMMAKFDINVFIIARVKSAGRRIGQCFHIQTPAGACGICDYTRENS